MICLRLDVLSRDASFGKITGRPAARWNETGSGAFLIGSLSNTSPGKDDEKAERQGLVISYLDRNSKQSIKIMPENWNQPLVIWSKKSVLFFLCIFDPATWVRKTSRITIVHGLLCFTDTIWVFWSLRLDVTISHDFLVWSRSNAVVHYAFNESIPSYSMILTRPLEDRR